MSSVNGSSLYKYVPLLNTFKNYKKGYVKKDLIAAATVAVVAIPQSMAYAIIAGVEPVYGLYTAIISTIISAIFGSSSHLIAGPTNAIALLVASSTRSFIGAGNFYEMLFLMTFIVGILQLLFGIIRLGMVIQYVSHAVIVGFTAGAGVLITLGQLNQLLGISIGKGYMTPIEKLYRMFSNIGQINPYSLFIGILTIIIIIACKKINKSLPGALIGIVVSAITVVVFSLEQKGVKLTGYIPSSLPPFRMLNFNTGNYKELFTGALPIAIIGLMEAISIAKSISGTSREKIDPNQEFIGQGMSNLVSSFFQCFPSSGSFTRSAINYYSGAVTRLSGIVSGIMISVILVFFAPFAQFIPMPSLAGVIMVIAYSMVNRNEMRKISKAGRSDVVVMWVTLGATVLLPDLDWAIYLGIAISIMLYLRDTNTVLVKILAPANENDFSFSEKEISQVKDKTNILIIQIEGSLYFGSAIDLENKLETLSDKANVFIIRMKRVSTIDITALDVIKQFTGRVQETGRSVVLCGVESEFNAMLLNSGMMEQVGADNIFISESEIFASSRKAIERARQIIENSQADKSLSKPVEPRSAEEGRKEGNMKCRL